MNLFCQGLQIEKIYDPRIHRENLLQLKKLLKNRPEAVNKISIALH